ncbi:MAG TPA: thioesterase family protein [Pseudogracilibacillus sp.]|nr:thioesterase family protein [Pseudogracilibacillus sp.]
MATWHQENLRVQYKDTDQMGVVHHGNYIIWFEIGRTEWMRENGMTYRELEEQGLFLPVLGVDLQYKASAYYDDCVAIFTKIATVSPVRLEFRYEVRKIEEVTFQKQQSQEVNEPFGELLTKGSSTHMWVNTDWKPAKINKIAPSVYSILQKEA